MNVYPGEGLGIGTAILGNALGQEYPAGTVIALCKVFGTLLTPVGDPVGSANSKLTNNTDGTTTLVDTWKGVTVTATLSTAQYLAGKVITTERVSVESNEYGYFELHIVQGLTANLSCPIFGKSVAVNTTGLDSVDISSYFV